MDARRRLRQCNPTFGWVIGSDLERETGGLGKGTVVRLVRW